MDVERAISFHYVSSSFSFKWKTTFINKVFKAAQAICHSCVDGQSFGISTHGQFIFQLSSLQLTGIYPTDSVYTCGKFPWLKKNDQFSRCTNLYIKMRCFSILPFSQLYLQFPSFLEISIHSYPCISIFIHSGLEKQNFAQWKTTMAAFQILKGPALFS